MPNFDVIRLGSWKMRRVRRKIREIEKLSEGFNPLKENWLRLVIYLGPAVATGFAIYYYTQGRSPLLIGSLLVFSAASIWAALSMGESFVSWNRWKHLLALVSLVADSATYLTQTDSPEQVVWFVTFPIFIFVIAGFSAGWKYNLVLFMVYVAGYFYPVFLDHPLNLQRDVVLQTVAAFWLTSVIFGVYQRKAEDYQRQLEETAFHDKLTGAMSRDWMYERISDEVAICHRKATMKENSGGETAETFSIVLFDLDDFKKINDTYGHYTGDEVLVNTVRVILQMIRSSDHVSRWGGEEFLLFFRETELDAALMITENIRMALADLASPGRNRPEGCTASFGVTRYFPGDLVEEMIRRADEAMYRAKLAGKNRVVMG